MAKKKLEKDKEYKNPLHLSYKDFMGKGDETMNEKGSLILSLENMRSELESANNMISKLEREMDNKYDPYEQFPKYFSTMINTAYNMGTLRVTGIAEKDKRKWRSDINYLIEYLQEIGKFEPINKPKNVFSLKK